MCTYLCSYRYASNSRLAPYIALSIHMECLTYIPENTVSSRSVSGQLHNIYPELQLEESSLFLQATLGEIFQMHSILLHNRGWWLAKNNFFVLRNVRPMGYVPDDWVTTFYFDCLGGSLLFPFKT